MAALPAGWNLIATGSVPAKSPHAFADSVSQFPPPTLGVATDIFSSLWAWDAERQAWFFYSPLLDDSGGQTAVKSYAIGKNYLHFEDYGKGLDVGTGFWVNKSY